MKKNLLSFLGLLSIWLLVAALVWHGFILLHNNTSLETTKIELIVQDYLLRHPQILHQMKKNLRAQEAAKEHEEREQTKKAVLDHFAKLLNAPGELTGITGVPPAEYDSILWYFTQPRCALCHELDGMILKFAQDHPNVQLRIFYWPFCGSENAQIVRLIMAGRYQQRSRELCLLTSQLSELPNLEAVRKLAADLPNLDLTQLISDAKKGEIDGWIRDNIIIAARLHLTGTPTIIFTDREGQRVSIIPGLAEEQLMQTHLSSVLPPKVLPPNPELKPPAKLHNSAEQEVSTVPLAESPESPAKTDHAPTLEIQS